MSLFPLGLIGQGGGNGAGANAMELIATTSGSGTSITFSSIPNTYKHLQIRYVGLTTGNGYRPQMYMNGDTGANYGGHALAGNASSVFSEVAYAGGGMNYMILSSYSVNSLNSSSPTPGIVDILDYTSTSKYKVVRTLMGGFNSNQIAIASGSWQSTAAITSLTITANGGTWASTSRFSLYGIKGA